MPAPFTPPDFSKFFGTRTVPGVKTGASRLGAGMADAAARLQSLLGGADVGRARLETLLGGAKRPQPAGTGMVAGTYTGAAGTRPYRLHVPPRALPAHPPLVVMLHGCTQSPEDFAVGTRMNALADRFGFVVLYPAQVQSANANLCWNWFAASDQTAEAGEPAILAGMVREIALAHGVDRGRIFVAGLSAGAATAANLGALHPDLFSAIGVHSGLAFGAAHDMQGAFAAMRSGQGGQGRISVPTIIFHGDRDSTVNVRNADAVAAQAMPAAMRADTEKGSAGRAYTRTRYSDEAGRSVLEQWTIEGAGHAWSGGDAAGSFTDPAGPDASSEMVRFFLAR